MLFAGNGIRRITSFFFRGMPASTGWRYPQQDKQCKNDQLHYSSASLPESDSGNPGSESPIQKTPMSPPVYADDGLEIYDLLDTNSPGSTMEHTMVQSRECQNHTQSTIPRSHSRDSLDAVIRTPGFRSCMNSTEEYKGSRLQEVEVFCRPLRHCAPRFSLGDYRDSL